MADRRPRLFDDRLGMVALLLAAVAATRAPLLASPHSYLDGDEAIMGLTALRVLGGESIPFLPYGAVFGTSLIETLSAVASSSILGVTEVALRLSALAVWCAASILVALAARRIAGSAAGLAFVVSSTIAPGWMHASVAAWHYQLSGYLGASGAIFASARLVAGVRHPQREFFFLGAWIGLAFFAQPIFALAALPFAGRVLLSRHRAQDVAILALGFAACASVYAAASYGAHASWSPPLFENADPLFGLRALPNRFWISMTGLYFLVEPFPAGSLATALTGLWCAGSALAAATAILRLVRNRDADFSLACLVGIGLVLFFSLAVHPGLYGYRYLLSTVSLQALLMGLELGHAVRGTRIPIPVAAAALALLALAVATSARELRRTSFSGSPVRRTLPEADSLNDLTRYLERRGVAHVYCTGPMFQWKLMFASGGRITARWVNPTDRIPAFPAAVDRARREGRPIALVGEAEDPAAISRALRARGLAKTGLSRVGEGYFAIVNPPADLLGDFRSNE